jgi:methylmalonyl-CoA mutase cobalamin-binding subunit
VFAGTHAQSDRPARTLEQSLVELGIETTYIGMEDDARRIAAVAAEQRADSVEVCLMRGTPGVLLLRQLLRELVEFGRRDVSIVVHRAR